MKAKVLANKKTFFFLTALTLAIVLVSFGIPQKEFQPIQQQQPPTDTVPPKKKTVNLDEALSGINDIDWSNIEKEIKNALKEVDAQKIQAEVKKAMNEVEWSKIQKEIKEALASVNFSDIQNEVQSALAKVDMEKMKTELAKIKEIDFSNMQKELENVKLELAKIKPEIEEAMQTAKEAIKEYTTFIDGLEADGLIDKEKFTIKHEDGTLWINGVKASEQVYDKYKTFLEKNKKFTYTSDGSGSKWME